MIKDASEIFAATSAPIHAASDAATPGSAAHVALPFMHVNVGGMAAIVASVADEALQPRCRTWPRRHTPVTDNSAAHNHRRLMLRFALQQLGGHSTQRTAIHHGTSICRPSTRSLR